MNLFKEKYFLAPMEIDTIQWKKKNNTVEVLKFGGKKMRFIEVNGTEHIFVDVGHCESLELYENDCVIKISDDLIVLSEDCLNKIACKVYEVILDKGEENG